MDNSATATTTEFIGPMPWEPPPSSAVVYTWPTDSDLTAAWTFAYEVIRDLRPSDAEKRELTRLALEHAVWVDRLNPPPRPRELRARHGYQDAPRLPCYRAVRRR